jgi:hypothetical protein
MDQRRRRSVIVSDGKDEVGFVGDGSYTVLLVLTMSVEKGSAKKDVSWVLGSKESKISTVFWRNDQVVYKGRWN